MSAPPVCLSDAAGMRRLLLDLAQERSVDRLLTLIVDRLAAEEGVALARIWLNAAGDIRSASSDADDGRDESAYLELAASAGRSRVSGEQWTQLDGAFRRFGFGVGKVGRIAATGEPLEVPEIAECPEILAAPEWARAEGIRAFGGQPLMHRDTMIGVLAVFTRQPLVDESLSWLRMMADHAAAAIANARAFEEIARLKDLIEQERDYLRDEVLDAGAFGEIVGASPPLQNVLEQVSLVAPTAANVLILGESGTGKELVAREIHRRSDRAEQPMVTCNCASIPRDLYESEFFGHVQGAFTGAMTNRTGRFELASGGTLFLDEVGEIPLDLQSKLLRVLQNGEYEAVGSAQTRTADVRIIAATNRDLKSECDAGRFREDLYYRLNVFPVHVAPLRERRDDIPLLAAHFIQLSARKLKRPAPRLTQRNIRDLQRYRWPGNIRELQNVIERAVITSVSGRLRFNLPVSDGDGSLHTVETIVERTTEILTESEMRQRERENIIAALRSTQWKIGGQGGAAELLGLKPTTLASRMKKLAVERPV